MEKTKVDKLKEMMKAKKEAESKVEPPSEPPVNTDEMTEQIKAAEDEAKAHYDKLLRVMAEFENFKKRIERERIEQAKYSNQSLMHDLLPVFDDFDRVLTHIPEDPPTEVQAIADGVKLVQNHFLTILAKHGLEPLEPSLGKAFDPNQHEAVSHIESDEYPEGIVAQEHRRGWKLHDRVVRAATVAVSKGGKTI